jgi:ABC-2 type transport system ATP-binding protein
MIKCSGGRHNVLHVFEYLSNTGTSFGRVFAEQPTLNDVFLEVTGKELRDEVQ